MNKVIKLVFLLLFPLLMSGGNLPGDGSFGKPIDLSKGKKDEKQPNRITRWNFGLNFGVYFANSYPAKFYDGSDNNVNKVSYILSNSYWYNAIDTLLRNPDTVYVWEYPGNMHYKITMTGGLFVRYNFDKHWGLCLDVNYTKLKAEDAVIFRVDISNFLTNPDLRTIPIQGIEDRMQFDILVQHNFWLKKSRTYIFLQGGINFDYARVKKSAIFVEGKEFNLVNIYGSQYIPNTNMQENVVIQGGVGYGLFLGGGIGVPLVDLLGIEPGAYVQYNTVNLERYNKQLKPSFGVYIRFLLGNIVPRPDEIN